MALTSRRRGTNGGSQETWGGARCSCRVVLVGSRATSRCAPGHSDPHARLTSGSNPPRTRPPRSRYGLRPKGFMAGSALGNRARSLELIESAARESTLPTCQWETLLEGIPLIAVAGRRARPPAFSTNVSLPPAYGYTRTHVPTSESGKRGSGTRDSSPRRHEVAIAATAQLRST